MQCKKHRGRGNVEHTSTITKQRMSTIRVHLCTLTHTCKHMMSKGGLFLLLTLEIRHWMASCQKEACSSCWLWKSGLEWPLVKRRPVPLGLDWPLAVQIQLACSLIWMHGFQDCEAGAVWCTWLCNVRLQKMVATESTPAMNTITHTWIHGLLEYALCRSSPLKPLTSKVIVLQVLLSN